MEEGGRVGREGRKEGKGRRKEESRQACFQAIGDVETTPPKNKLMNFARNLHSCLLYLVDQEK